ncbi:hypothetical protein LCGC14_1578470 [marine sediment metagenome]|uniref:Uncharacterized protein n=1 Tax=marine sediment metagenome TaxID=412755 RepID=A0A0F9LHW6_9ZZZZ
MSKFKEHSEHGKKSFSIIIKDLENNKDRLFSESGIYSIHDYKNVPSFAFANIIPIALEGGKGKIIQLTYRLFVSVDLDLYLGPTIEIPELADLGKETE